VVDQRYLGIRFPDRAEALGDFAGYRVFLDPWEPLADELRRLWEPLADRGESSILAIHGQQGAGKTLLTRKLTRDFEATRVSPTVTPDDNNIWHRVTGRKDKSLTPP
jgi:pantothenate kinase-related protein Tda10